MTVDEDTNPRPLIVHITTVHPARDNRIFHKECRALSEAGLNVCLLAVSDQDEDVNGVRCIALPRRRGRVDRVLLGSIHVWRTLRSLSPALIHVHDPELIPLAVIWRLVRNRPAIFDAHEDLARQVISKPYIARPLRPIVAVLARLLEKLAGTLLPAIVVANPESASNFIRSKVTIVQNFPWPDSFPTTEPIRAEQQDLVYVGAISSARGFHEMVELAAGMKSNGVLVLAGTLSADAPRGEMDPKKVKYLGQIPAQGISSTVGSARVGLALLHPIPNHLKIQSTKIYEYMAAARPFVASDFPLWVDQLAKYDCGLFVNPLDAKAVGTAVDHLLNDTEYANMLGRRGRVAFEENFSFQPEARKLVRLTKRLLSGTNLNE